ncbi:MAG: cell wall-active antibiotics response protein LiaF [Streptococcaceae bacterium]|jgi:predicted membrane protein|nr:cell wall-active antibiotics response protein LiaF [Streptococcaceae bacterium]
MTKFKLFIIIELILVGLLGVSLVRNPFFLVMLGLALFLGYLSTRVDSWTAQKTLQHFAIAFGVVALILFLVNGYTWLVLLFPIIVAIIFWKASETTYTSVKGQPDDDYEAEQDSFQHRAIFDTHSDNAVSRLSGNDVIDLAETTFQPIGNELTIKKASGDTKIIVPDDVAVVLDVTTLSGLVKIFGDITKVNAEHVRYMTEDYGTSDKRIRIVIHVGRGNVEVVKG